MKKSTTLNLKRESDSYVGHNIQNEQRRIDNNTHRKKGKLRIGLPDQDQIKKRFFSFVVFC